MTAKAKRIITCPHCEGPMQLQPVAHDGKPTKVGDITLCADCLSLALLCEGGRLEPIEERDLGAPERALVESIRNRIVGRPGRGRIRT